MLKNSISLHVLVHRIMFLIAAPPIVVLGCYIYQSSVDTFKTDAYQSAISNIENVNASITQFDEFNRKSLATFAHNPVVQRMGKGAYNKGEPLEHMDVAMHGTLMIIDENDDLLATNRTELSVLLKQDARILDGLADSKMDQGSSLKIRNKQYLFFSRNNLGTGWKIIELVPVQEVNQVIANTFGTFIGIMVILLALISFIAKRLKGFITKPVDRIIENLDAIGKGDYLARIDYGKEVSREFMAIRESVNQMAKHIHDQTCVLIQKEQEINSQYEEINALYEETTAMNETQEELLREIEESYRLTIKSLSNAIEANDVYTRGHCDRVREFAVLTAQKMDCTLTDVVNLEYAALLHDVGKVGIPYHILNKSGRLNNDEFDLMKNHPEIGYNILKDIPFLEEVAQIIKQHHERYDGNGYPNQVAGEDIHFLARVLSVSDAFDAMTTARPYRKTPLSDEMAYAELEKGKGTQFDAGVVDAFVACHIESRTVLLERVG